jgi:two-component system, LytTR family, sensor kinase
MQMVSVVNFFILEQILKYVFPAVISYIIAFFVLPVSEGKRNFRILLFFLSLVLSLLLRYFTYFILLPNVSSYPMPQGGLSVHFFFAGFWWWLHYTIYGWVYWYYFKSLETERKLRQTETAKLQSDKEKIQAQYNYLKTQINPHFLYNTLNFFYTSTRKNNPDVAEGVLIMSNLMQYSLSMGDGDGNVALADEWEQLNNYIALQQLRSGHRHTVRVNRQGPLENIQLPPHVLITLVENAFKHGDMEHPIDISLLTDTSLLSFTVTNYLKLAEQRTHSPQTANGLGLQNIEKRLAYEYNNSALFEYGEANGQYRVHLQLPVAVPPQPIPALT